ncbi:MAG: DNA-binding protein [Desulfobacterales bacterium CG23_combo_of_CG06-09_8_20_14_all_52_9]|nr:MAG: DNA-binding protein [Desulfobacterales bacterium CG23_combo_of_CG06-09_8_20_14_all_52_9]
MNKKFKPPEEWFKQADYDLETAEAMFKSGRYIYTVFMCHLTIEKALKGLCTKHLQKRPPKTHNLLYLIEKAKVDILEELYDFIFSLNRVSIPTRYPDDLERIMKDYDKKTTENILFGINCKKIMPL